MPWAWGLGFSLIGAGTHAKPAYPFLLALVLAFQLLPGHFQLAFLTQCGLVLMLLWTAAERYLERRKGAVDANASLGRLSISGTLIVMLALMCAFPLAAAQLVPTARLALLAGGERDFEYLSGFASPPFHLVNYVAPGLFHRSPLWRPLVWDPFHAMPEEHMAYVGLVPLFLACMAAARECRRDRTVRLLTFLCLVTLLLSLGPYVPGFRLLIKLPGFSFFRAPSRWSVATALALGLLAGKGFDRFGEWSRAGRSLFRLGLISIGWVAATVLIIELALLSTGTPGLPEVSRGFQKILSALPCNGDPSFVTVLAQARRPLPDPRIAAAIPDSVVLRKSMYERIFIEQRGLIYLRELGEATALLLLVFLTAWLCGKRSIGGEWRRGVLLCLTLLDLWVLGQHRLVDVAPLTPLVQQSPLLKVLAREPRGTRIADRRLRNLPMAAGLAPISAYRTLDLPAVGSLTAFALGPLNNPRIEADVRAALRATGSGLRLIDPVESQEGPALGWAKIARERIEDPVLAAALFGADWVKAQGAWARQFSIWRPEQPVARAWFVRERDIESAAALEDWSGDARDILGIIARAEPLSTKSLAPEEITISVATQERGTVIISQLFDPQWNARWESQDERLALPDNLRAAFRRANEQGGWQCVDIPAPGHWILRLEYEAHDAVIGMGLSIIAWACWLIGVVRAGFVSRSNMTARGQNQTENTS